MSNVQKLTGALVLWLFMGYYGVAVIASSFVERFGILPDGGWGAPNEIVLGILTMVGGPFSILVALLLGAAGNLTDPLWSWPWF